MKRIRTFSMAAGMMLALAAPAMASSASSVDHPSCDGDDKKKEKDTSVARPQCDGEDKKKEKDNSSAVPSCDGDDKKKEKDPAVL